MPEPNVQTDRRESRRRQILDAAESCFRRLGFHGASVAEIAHEAGMSVGQIYRFYPSKEAVIEALVRDDMDRRLEVLQTVIAERPDDIFATLAARSDIGVDLAMDRDRTALMLEIAAEAARNPRVRAIAEATSEAAMAAVRAHLQHVRPPAWTAEELEARLELIGAIFEGIAFQASFRSRPVTPQIRALVAETVQHLLTS